MSRCRCLGRVTSVKTPDNATVTTSYSGNTVTATDQKLRDRQSTTDALGRLTQVIEDPGTGGLGHVTTYAYDVLANLKTVTQGAQTRSFTYDSLSRLKTAVNPESGTISYVYDDNGNLAVKTDARGASTHFSYDVLNRATRSWYNGSSSTSATTHNSPVLPSGVAATDEVYFYYDAQTLPAGAPSFVRGSSTGRLVGVTYGTGSSAGTYRGYDAMGQVVRQYQRTDSVNYLVEATYNKAGAMLSETYPAVPGAADRRTVSYTSDAAGRLASLSSVATSYAPAAGVTSVSYAPHGALASETLGNSLIHAQTYNNRLQPTAIKLGTAALPISVMNLTYNYGTTMNNGNVQSISYAGGGLSYTQTFGYDQLNRLTTSQEGASWSQTNSYDRYGNRTIVGSGMTFDPNNNRITNAGYTYDPLVGNLLTDGAHAYTYDAENKVSKVDNVSGYVYDGEGQRVRKLVGENFRFIYGIGGQQIAEFSGANGTLKKEYIYGASGLVATIEPTAVNANGTRYTTSDHLGSPRVVTTSSATVVSRHDYKPFGEEIGSGIGGRTPAMGYGVVDGLRQKFTSKERDNETGLDYFEARYYSSAHGRFTSADSVLGSALNPQTLNLYAYVHNNPLAFTDPTGHIAQRKDESLRWQIFEEMSGGNRRVTPTGAAPVAAANGNSAPQQGPQNPAPTQTQPLTSVTVLTRNVNINYGEKLSIAERLAASTRILAAAMLINAHAADLTADEKKAIGKIRSFSVVEPGSDVGATGSGLRLGMSDITGNSIAWLASLIGHEGQHNLNIGKYSGSDSWLDEQSASSVQLAIGTTLGMTDAEKFGLKQWIGIGDSNRENLQRHMKGKKSR